MMKTKTSFWVGLSLFNLFIVALFGFLLRSKILFPLPFVDYPKFLNAHSYFALSGWLTLCLLTLLIFTVLPEEVFKKPLYQWLLAGIEVCSFGIAASFLLKGNGVLLGCFSLLYIITAIVVASVLIRDAVRWIRERTIRLLVAGAATALLISVLVPLAFGYLLYTKAGSSTLRKDFVYTFLHFQYNGFFTLSVLALFFQRLHRTTVLLNKKAERFVWLLLLSLVPSLTLSLLWHGEMILYTVGGIATLLILSALVQFLSFCQQTLRQKPFHSSFANAFLFFAALSFILKTALNGGTLIPALGNAIYGDRPVIIGFLHLVFLGFVTFFLLAFLIETGQLSIQERKTKIALVFFAFGIIANEVFLAVQGLSIVFNSNSRIYNWALWIGSLLLLIGAAGIVGLFWKQFLPKPRNDG